MRRALWLVLALLPLGLPAAVTVNYEARVGELTEIDMGDFAPGEERTLQFNLINDQAEDFHVGNISTSCGCTRPSRDVVMIPAGESASFEVVYHAQSDPGQRVSQIFFTATNPEIPRWGIRLTAHTVTDVEVQPTEIEFGDVPLGASGELVWPLTIINNGEETLTITGISTASNIFAVDGAELSIAPGERAEIPVRLPATAQAGRLEDWVVVNTDSESLPTIEVMVRANVTGAVEVTPDRVWFGFVPQGQTRTTTLRVVGQAPDFAVTNVTTDAQGVTASAEQVEGSTWDIAVNIDTNVAPPGLVQSNLVIDTNDPRQPQVQVELLGSINPQ